MHELAPEEHYRRLARVYLGSPTNEYYRPRIEISEGAAHLEIDVREDLYHAATAVHGSHYFKCLDDSAFFAVNSLVRDVFVLTATFTVHLMRPISSGTLVAEGRVVNASKRMFWAESVLRSSEGRQLARGNGTFMRSQIPLDERIGYRE
ncbi:MAG: PaaI family thioesterase [Planctomycetota bacterium]|nr:PaaI family thioesterase [Planctomycetota bacterium]